MTPQKHENTIRLILLEDQALLRASLAHLLALEPDLDVVGECGASADALALVSTAGTDVVLLDFGHALRGEDGFLSAAVHLGFQGKFLIVADEAPPTSVGRAIALGASGIFLKTEDPRRLIQAIRVVANDGVWLDPRMFKLLLNHSLPPVAHPQLGGNGLVGFMPGREQQVLSGILSGLTNKQIGKNLGISEGCVKTAVQQLFSRAGVRTRGQLVRVALETSVRPANGQSNS